MRSAVWQSDNGHIVVFSIDPSGSFLFDRIEGNLMGARAQVVQAPMQDGATTYSVANEPRTVILYGHVQGKGSGEKDAEHALDEAVNRLCMALNPKYFGTLTYKTYAGDFAIRCRPVALPTIAKRYTGTVISPFSVDFTTDNPYWYEATERIVVLGMLYKSFRFPLVLNFEHGGSPLGVIYNALNANNATSEPIAPTIEVFSAADLVRAKNATTGKTLEINRPVGVNQKMVIDVPNYKATLFQLNGQGAYEYLQNVTNWVTLNSDWWALMPGDNVITINDDFTATAPAVILRYRIPVMGVTT